MCAFVELNKKVAKQTADKANRKRDIEKGTER
jgi:hypothetical protein